MKRPALFFTALLFAGSLQAATLTYVDRATFEAALDPGYTLIDTSAYADGTPIGDTLPAAVTSFGAPSTIRAADGVLLNGQGFYGTTTPNIGLNFSPGINGVGGSSGEGYGGMIMIYSGLNGTGSLLGSAAYSVTFGGIISSVDIGSVIFTCDFNFDLKCALIDPTFGSSTAVVPLPAALWLFATALLGLSGMAGRRTARE